MPSATYTEFDCYKLLGVPQSAGPQEIRNAYHRASLRAHPDRGGSHDAQVRLNLAHEILKDPVLRQAHDRYWYRDGARASSPPPPRDERARRAPGRPSAPPQPREPLEYLYRRANARMDERRRESARRRQTRLDETISQFAARFEQSKRTRRTSLIWSCVLTAGAVLASSANVHLVWIGAALSWLWFMALFSGVTLHTRTVRFDDPGWRDAIRSAAVEKVNAESRAEQESDDRYRKILASLSELLGRSSSFADSEDQVARRIAAALFIMGYQPLNYDRQARILVFTDGEERLLVRYRHRPGMATNVTYVERMVEAMGLHGASAGLLFCTPGLSGNGAAVASKHGIKWYTLERMNEWIEQVALAEYEGPAGDLFQHLDRLMQFIQSIAVPLPYSGPSRRRW